MATSHSVDPGRFLGRLRELAEIGRDPQGRRTRLAASDGDRAGRDLVAGWMRDAGLEVVVDRIGNLIGLWRAEGTEGGPVMMGSHIDTVIDAGAFDGCTGVLAGLAAIETLQAARLRPARPLAVAAFTNEEGVRYAPDMMGSLVYAGGLPVETALGTIEPTGRCSATSLPASAMPARTNPASCGRMPISNCTSSRGRCWNAKASRSAPSRTCRASPGRRWSSRERPTTPAAQRQDAGVAAAGIVAWLRDRARAGNGRSVATVGRMRFEPDAINVIPSRAVFTVDLRDPDAERLAALEADLARRLDEVAHAEGVAVTVRRLARFDPVIFDARIVAEIERAARARGLSTRRMTSGAGHDAQMMARICPAAMIFVPSVGGISHNPRELTADADLVAGANVLLDVGWQLARGA